MGKNLVNTAAPKDSSRSRRAVHFDLSKNTVHDVLKKDAVIVDYEECIEFDLVETTKLFTEDTTAVISNEIRRFIPDDSFPKIKDNPFIIRDNQRKR